MKVGDEATRLLKLAQLLFDGGTVTSAYIEETFEVSYATAKRDMVKLEQCLPVVVEHIESEQQQEMCWMKVLRRKPFTVVSQIIQQDQAA